MKCPYCQSEKTKTLDSRSMTDYVRRRKLCMSCELRFTTMEYAFLPNPAGITGHGIHEKYLAKAIAGSRREQ